MTAVLRRTLLTIAAAVALVAPLAGCADDVTHGRPDTGLEALTLTSIEPDLVVPGSVIVIIGDSFIAEPTGVSHLRLTGDFSGTSIDVELPATFVDFTELHVDVTPEVIALFGADEGSFTGNAAVVIDFLPDASKHVSPPLPINLAVRSTLVPGLADLQAAGEIHVNEPIAIEGDGFLLGGNEGTTFARVQGCYVAQGGTDCVPVEPVEVPIVPDDDDPFDRTHATFPFSPRIAGIQPGSFEGDVELHNVLANGEEGSSDSFHVEYDLIPTEIYDATTSTEGGASLGQYIDIEGGGFVGGNEGLTILQFVGDYTFEATGQTVPVDLELIPEFVDGELVRYVVNEDDSLGQAIDVRVDNGTFDGMITPRITFESDELEGTPAPFSFKILPVHQVVWVRFLPSYVDSLRAFGMRALDEQIRARILEVLQRDYTSINIEFRTEEPTDYKLYATVDIAGPDPNDQGLLGYDNTPGKDIDNQRLFDHIGGVNALTQEDGFPGFGGIFIDSLFAFSHHPPHGGSQDTAVDLFDDIFDPFRPDTGDPVSSADLAMGPLQPLTSGDTCPADDRREQAACAVWVFGSMVGTTVSHENGHSLGLADPLGTRFHDLGDAPNRLMDAGGARTFEERSELMGQGPSVFCDDEYQYLREILPSDEPETTIERPYC